VTVILAAQLVMPLTVANGNHEEKLQVQHIVLFAMVGKGKGNVTFAW
jgi:hypothetical protein